MNQPKYPDLRIAGGRRSRGLFKEVYQREVWGEEVVAGNVSIERELWKRQTALGRIFINDHVYNLAGDGTQWTITEETGSSLLITFTHLFRQLEFGRIRISFSQYQQVAVWIPIFITNAGRCGQFRLANCEHWRKFLLDPPTPQQANDTQSPPQNCQLCNPEHLRCLGPIEAHIFSAALLSLGLFSEVLSTT